MTKEELIAEEHICNGKCQNDITRNYVHCKTCTRLKDFFAGYKAGKADLEKENAELKENFRICEKNADTYFDNLTKATEIIENIIQVTWGEGWNYSLDWKVKAEQFLKDSEVEK